MTIKKSDVFFKLKSEISFLIGKKNWEDTPLGDIETWPDYLVATLIGMLESQIATFIAVGKKQIQFYNDAFSRMFGLEKHPEALGMVASDFWVNHQWVETEEIWAEVWKGKIVKNDHYKLLINRYGYSEETYFDFSNSPLRDTAGNVVGVIVTSLETYNKHVVIDEEKAKSERLYSLFMQAPIPICVFTGPNHVYSFANPHYLSLIADQRRNTLLNKPVKEVFSLLDGNEIYPILDRVYKTGKPYSGKMRLKIGKKSTGNTCVSYFDAIYQPWRDYSGVIKGIFMVANDITNQVMARKKIEKLMKDREEFMYIASHELKTPLTTLRLQTQLLLREVAKGNVSLEKITKKLKVDERQLTRLAGLIDEILDVTRINTGKLSLKLEKFDLCQLVREVVDKLSDQLNAIKSELILEVCDEAVGYWDYYRFEQLVLNLMTNAMKYGGGKPIHLGLKRQDEKIILTVKDQGIGIAKQDQQRIFKQFERVVCEEIAGLGLGLYIVKQIVDLHKGNIRVESEIGQGSSFIIEIPILGEIKKQNAKHHVLVVEDDKDLGESIVELLQDENFVVDYRSSGKEALEFLNNTSKRPNVILLDLMMPEMNGIEFHNELKTQSRLSRIPIVLMSAVPDLMIKRNTTEVSEYIKKPLNIENLLTILKRVSLQNQC